MLYSKPRILSESSAMKSIQSGTDKSRHIFVDSNPLLQEATQPAYEADE